jgi:hypothetical protein
MYNSKNYTEQGGEVTVIGGKLTVNGTLELGDGCTATGLPQAANQAASTATSVADLKADLNSLLEKLKTCGLMAADTTN